MKQISNLETLSKLFYLKRYKSKIYGKVDKYFNCKNHFRFIIKLRLLFFHFKSLFKFALQYQSEYSDNICHILLCPGGGIGDHIYFLKYCYCLRKKFNDLIKIDIFLEENEKYLKDFIYKHVSYIDNVFENKPPKHDIEFDIIRFPEITNAHLKRFLIYLTAGIGVYIVYYISFLEKEIRERKCETLTAVLLIFILSPFFYTYFLKSGCTFGRLDIVLILLFLMSVKLIFQNKLVWFIPVYTCIGVLVYDVYTICFFPLIFVLLVHRYCNKQDKKSLFLLLATTISDIGTNLCTYFFGFITEVSKITYFTYRQQHFDLPLDRSITTMYPFIRNSFRVNIDDIAGNHLYFRLILLFVFSVPLCLFIYYTLKKLFSNNKGLLENLIVTLLMISPFSMIFIIYSSDFMRYFCDWYFAMNITFIVLCLLDKNRFYETYLSVYQKLTEKNSYIVTLIVAYSFLIGVYNSCWPFAKIINVFIDNFNHYIN